MPRVRVRLHTESIHVEYTGGESVFHDTIEPLILRAAGAGRASRRSASAAAGTGGNGAAQVGAHPAYRPPSQEFGTFRRQLDPRLDEEGNRIAAFAFFLWNYEKKEVFCEDEVAGCFVANGEEPPSDTGALYEDLVTRRILRPADDAGAWRLTSKGRAHVRHHLLSA